MALLYSSVSQDSEKENRSERDIIRYNMTSPNEGRKCSSNGTSDSYAVLNLKVGLANRNHIDSEDGADGISSFSSPNKVNPRTISYQVFDDTPSMRTPSSAGLPAGWEAIHDRCIAYLSTHAPLTRSGKVPAHEATVERYSLRQIADFLAAKFPQFGRKKIPGWAIEKRLQMLDLNENEYFKVPYGGYRYEDWGRHI